MAKDKRPICDCNARTYPHKIDDKKCGGRKYFQYVLIFEPSHCEYCNCFREEDVSCDALDGRESIKGAECYIDAIHYRPGEHLPLTPEEPDDEYT